VSVGVIAILLVEVGWGIHVGLNWRVPHTGRASTSPHHGLVQKLGSLIEACEDGELSEWSLGPAARALAEENPCLALEFFRGRLGGSYCARDAIEPLLVLGLERGCIAQVEAALDELRVYLDADTGDFLQLAADPRYRAMLQSSESMRRYLMAALADEESRWLTKHYSLLAFRCLMLDDRGMLRDQDLDFLEAVARQKGNREIAPGIFRLLSDLESDGGERALRLMRWADANARVGGPEAVQLASCLRLEILYGHDHISRLREDPRFLAFAEEESPDRLGFECTGEEPEPSPFRGWTRLGGLVKRYLIPSAD
jgi:hypothetical protein